MVHLSGYVRGLVVWADCLRNHGIMKPVQEFNAIRDRFELAALEYEAARQRGIPHFLEKAECNLAMTRAELSAFYVQVCMLKANHIPAINDAADALERVKATAKARALRNILKD